jgi:hypothetical protein
MGGMSRSSANPFRYFNSSPEVIRLVVMMYVRYPLSLRNVEDLLFERGIDICHETVRLWWNRFGPVFASEIRRQRVSRMRGLEWLELVDSRRDSGLSAPEERKLSSERLRRVEVTPALVPSLQLLREEVLGP